MKLTFKTFPELTAAFDLIDASLPKNQAPDMLFIVKNIRCFSDWSVVPLSDLTILTGPNSSGKSTILQALAAFHFDQKSLSGQIRGLAGDEGPSYVGFSCDWRLFTWGANRLNRHTGHSLDSQFASDFTSTFLSFAPFLSSDDTLETAGAPYKRFTWILEIEATSYFSNVVSVFLFGDERCIGFLSFHETGAADEVYGAMKLLPETCSHVFGDDKGKEVLEVLTSQPVWRRDRLNRHFSKKIDATAAWKALAQQPAYCLSESRNFLNFSFQSGPQLVLEYGTDRVGDIALLSLLVTRIFHIPAMLIPLHQFSQKALGRGGGATYLVPVREVPDDLVFEFSSWHGNLHCDTTTNSAYRGVAISCATGKKADVQEINDWLRQMLATECRLAFQSHQIVERQAANRGSRAPNRQRKLERRVELFLKIGKNTRVKFSEVGTGVSQVLPVIATSLSGVPGCDLISQPELHLHPRAQSILGDLFLLSARKGRKKVIETHSEHLILRLLRRVSEASRSRSKTKLPGIRLIYIDPASEGSECHLIRIDEQGQFLDAWPRGFFEERFDDLFA